MSRIEEITERVNAASYGVPGQASFDRAKYEATTVADIDLLAEVERRGDWIKLLVESIENLLEHAPEIRNRKFSLAVNDAYVYAKRGRAALSPTIVDRAEGAGE